MKEDTIDPKNPPAGSERLDSAQGPVIRIKDGRVYHADTGERVALDTSGVDPFGLASLNLLNMLGLTPEQTQSILTRAGVILLGSALCIAGFVLVVSGTRAASLVKSAVPVVGKVL